MKLFRHAILASASCTLMMSSFAFGVGAIAVDDEEGEDEPGYGLVTGKASKEEAKAAALTECKNAGNNNCEFKVWFEKCGAYAVSAKTYGIGWGADKGAAEKKAKDDCGEGCRIAASDCE